MEGTNLERDDGIVVFIEEIPLQAGHVVCPVGRGGIILKSYLCSEWALLRPIVVINILEAGKHT